MGRRSPGGELAKVLSLPQSLRPGAAGLAPAGFTLTEAAGGTAVAAAGELRVDIFRSIEEIDASRWDELVGPRAVIRSHAYLRAIETAGINDCRYFYPVVTDAAGRMLGHCCVYTITTDLAQILPAVLAPLARLIRKRWPGFLQVKITECASPHVIGHGFSLREGVPHAPVLQALETAIARIARGEGSPLVVIRDFRADELANFSVLATQGYQQVSSLPQARIRVRWRTYEEYLAAMRSRYRKDLRRRLRRAATQGQHIRVLSSFGELSTHCVAQVRLAYERSRGIKREVLGPAYYRNLDAALGEHSLLLLAERDKRLMGHGMVLVDEAHLVATSFGREAGPAGDVWFQLLDAAVRMGIERQSEYINLGLGSYEAKSLMGAELEPLYCWCRSRHALLNALMKLVPRAMEPTLPRVHRVFRSAE